MHNLYNLGLINGDEVIKKSLLGNVNKNNDVSVLKEFYGTAFNRVKAEDMKVPFACPSYNLKKNQVFLMNRGGMDQVLSTCMAYPPFFKPYQGNISAIRDVTATAQYLRQKGANYIVFVNVLQAPGGSKAYTMDASATDNVLWSEIAGSYNKPLPGVDIRQYNKAYVVFRKLPELYAQINQLSKEVDNIKKQFSEAYNYACELEVLDAMIVKKWCKSGVFEEKGFTRSKKSLRDLQKEIDELINKYENDKENLDLLEQLQTYDYEVEDLLKNIGAFLYEMACEDSPFGDHTELYHKTVEREWKYN
jgi:regulator of replication initiation timing